MTRDPLDQLRAADPVPHAVAYPEDEVAARVADIVEHDGQLPASIGSAPERRGPSRWLPAALVAAAVLVLAVVSAVVLTRRADHDHAAGAAPVTCAVSTAGGTRAVKARLTQAEGVIATRVKQLNGTATSFVTDVGHGSIGFTPRQVSVAAAAQVCRPVTVSVRPVVAPFVDIDTGAPRQTNPLAGLRFTVPSTGAAYARLTAAQRAQVTAAISHYDCTSRVAASAVQLACSDYSGVEQVLILGPALLTGPDVQAAATHGPETAGGTVQYTVDLTFRAAAAARLMAFTAAHHSGAAGAELDACAMPGRTPCADFLGFLVGSVLDSVPATQATVGASVQLAGGGFDRFTAEKLGADYTAAAVQLHPR